MEFLYRPSTLEKVRDNFVEKILHCAYSCKKIESPVGPLILIASEVALLSLGWGHALPKFLKKLDIEEMGNRNSILQATASQLEEYFAGKRISFDIPLAPNGTNFQRSVWQELLKIPYGQTISYGEQARRLGRPNSARAVGAANGKNPIGIVIPCHRILGASGSLTGFAGGIELKRQLLAIEGVRVTN